MMKKSILSLSAAVALGGLGFATGANAVIATSQDTGAGTGAIQADRLVLNPAGTGHMLFTPYYTAQGGNVTFLNIVNTDSSNGKAIKVRFRGAGNSDDVLDFTLFLSPGDVWSGVVSQNDAGFAQVATQDNSCTAPKIPSTGQAFSNERIKGLPDEAAATREGYLEVINMADVDMKSDLGKTILHDDDGVPPCDSAVLNPITTGTTPTDGTAEGLINPTGQLFGDWSIVNLADLGTYSADMTAVAASNKGIARNGAATQVAAAVNYFPQKKANLPSFIAAGNYTADPLLAGGIITPLVYDFPDMSTPLIKGNTPNQQVHQLNNALQKDVIMNEWVTTANVPDARVPFSTDWVISQPTRRYYAAYDYKNETAVLNPGGNGLGANPYADYETCATDNGPQIGMLWRASLTNREEQNVVSTDEPEFSPGDVSAPLAFCGEVAVLKFGDESVLHASQTLQSVSNFSTGLPEGGAGWGSILVGGAPVTGFAAVEFKTRAGTNFGQTYPHRWRNALDNDDGGEVTPETPLNPGWGENDDGQGDEGGEGGEGNTQG